MGGNSLAARLFLLASGRRANGICGDWVAALPVDLYEPRRSARDVERGTGAFGVSDAAHK